MKMSLFAGNAPGMIAICAWLFATFSYNPCQDPLFRDNKERRCRRTDTMERRAIDTSYRLPIVAYKLL